MVKPSVHLVFDLDDTLYPEKDYVHSALAFAGRLIEETFQVGNAASFLIQAFEHGQRDVIDALWIAEALPQAMRSDVVSAMRDHRPNIKLPHDSVETLKALEKQGVNWSLLTDGRSVTQRRKIEALGIKGASGIYISEECGVRKPEIQAYTQIVEKQPDACMFFYIADNPAKDFIAPNALGWKTIMLRDRGRNIHSQNVFLPNEYLAKIEINVLSEILSLVNFN